MRHIDELTILIQPGLGGAGPDHWQTHWQQAFPGMQRVEQSNWETPVYEEWSGRLTEAVTRARQPIVLELVVGPLHVEHAPAQGALTQNHLELGMLDERLGEGEVGNQIHA